MLSARYSIIYLALAQENLQIGMQLLYYVLNAKKIVGNYDYYIDTWPSWIWYILSETEVQIHHHMLAWDFYQTSGRGDGKKKYVSFITICITM